VALAAPAVAVLAAPVAATARRFDACVPKATSIIAPANKQLQLQPNSGVAAETPPRR
jgi:hypothetical protein